MAYPANLSRYIAPELPRRADPILPAASAAVIDSSNDEVPVAQPKRRGSLAAPSMNDVRLPSEEVARNSNNTALAALTPGGLVLSFKNAEYDSDNNTFFSSLPEDVLMPASSPDSTGSNSPSLLISPEKAPRHLNLGEVPRDRNLLKLVAKRLFAEDAHERYNELSERDLSYLSVASDRAEHKAYGERANDYLEQSMDAAGLAKSATNVLAYLGDYDPLDRSKIANRDAARSRDNRSSGNS